MLFGLELLGLELFIGKWLEVEQENGVTGKWGQVPNCEYDMILL